MGLLRSLFGRKEKVEARPDQMLVSKMVGQMEQNEFTSRTCGYPGCGRTCMVPTVWMRLCTPNIEKFFLDVGGYCPGCRAYHCHRHLHFQPESKDGLDYHVATCRKCDSRVGSAPARDPELEEAIASLTKLLTAK